MYRVNTCWKRLWMAAALGCLAGPAGANTVSYVTGPTHSTSGAAVNAAAEFIFDASAHTVTVELLNLQLNPTGVSQALSGVQFDLTNLSGYAAPTISSTSASTFDVAANGYASADSETPHWVAEPVSGSTVTLCEICATHGHPDQLILGGPDAAMGSKDKYTAARGSIAGNPAHNSFLLGSGATYSEGVLAGLHSTPTWVLSLPQITVSTTLSQVRFYFGTTFGTNEVVDSLAMTPEPTPIVLIGGGVMLIMVARVARGLRKK